MSNPFDQFASDFQAALPPNAPGAQPPAAAPASAASSSPGPPKPVMNTSQPPPMNMQQQQPPPQGGGYGGGFMGQPAMNGYQQNPPPADGQGAFGQNPYQMGQPGGMMGMPPQQPPQPSVSQGSSDPFSSFGQPAPASGPPAPGGAPPQGGGLDNPFASMSSAPAPSSNPPQGGSDQLFGGAPAQPPAPDSAALGNTASGSYGDPWGNPEASPGAPPQQNPDAAQFGAPPSQYGQPPSQPQPGDGSQLGAPPGQYGQPPQGPGDASQFGAPPGHYGQPPQQPGPSSHFGGPPPGQQPPSQQPADNSQYGAPPGGQYGQQPPQQQQQPTNPDPSLGALVPAQQQPPNADPSMGALVPSQQQSNPYAQHFSSYGQPPNAYGQPPNAYGQPPNAYGQPPNQYGQPPNQYGQPPNQYGQPPNQYGQQPAPPPMDPFSVFEAQQSSAPEPAPAAPSNAIVPAQPGMPAAHANPSAASDDDFWGAFSADAPKQAAEPEPEHELEPEPAPKQEAQPDRSANIEEEKKGDDGLPPGGEWYDARIFTPTLGVMFFKPQELTDSLFLHTDKSLVDGLTDRPVVAFIVEGSSARSAGVELGHVLLKVNGVDVKNPKEASRLIKEGPRPLPLLFYVPNTDVVVAEGEHMVKYDTRETTAPNSAKDWKPKYVVIGGIIAQPWMMNMYRSKSEYDIAVIETQARRPVSVKVKQFSLQGARIQNDWQGPQMVKYKNKLHPWKYIVVLPVARNPIKIASPNLASLKPVHEGIRRVLLAQQRDRGGRAPARDNYAHAHPQQHHQQQQQQAYAQSSAYGY